MKHNSIFITIVLSIFGIFSVEAITVEEFHGNIFAIKIPEGIDEILKELESQNGGALSAEIFSDMRRESLNQSNNTKVKLEYAHAFGISQWTIVNNDDVRIPITFTKSPKCGGDRYILWKNETGDWLWLTPTGALIYYLYKGFYVDFIGNELDKNFTEIYLLFFSTQKNSAGQSNSAASSTQEKKIAMSEREIVLKDILNFPLGFDEIHSQNNAYKFSDILGYINNISNWRVEVKEYEGKPYRFKIFNSDGLNLLWHNKQLWEVEFEKDLWEDKVISSSYSLYFDRENNANAQQDALNYAESIKMDLQNLGFKVRKGKKLDGDIYDWCAYDEYKDLIYDIRVFKGKTFLSVIFKIGGPKDVRYILNIKNGK